MGLNLLKFLGFYGDDDDYDEEEDYGAERPAKRAKKLNNKKSRRDQEDNNINNNDIPSLVIFRGVPSDDMRSRLRDALRNGAILLLDLSELSERELEEEGRGFITFMGGVAFASGGSKLEIGHEQYIITPGDGMCEEWVAGDA